METSAHQRSALPLCPVAGKQQCHNFASLRSVRCTVHSKPPFSEHTEAARFPQTIYHIMGSSKTSKVPANAKSRKHKQFRKIVLEATNRAKSMEEESSVFDDLSEFERSLLFSYFYDHPEELPDRGDTSAMRHATEKPLSIKVKFDQNIFERDVCLRSIPDHELEAVDPFTNKSQVSQGQANLLHGASPSPSAGQSALFKDL